MSKHPNFDHAPRSFTEPELVSNMFREDFRRAATNALLEFQRLNRLLKLYNAARTQAWLDTRRTSRCHWSGVVWVPADDGATEEPAATE